MKTEKQIKDYLAECKKQHEYNKKYNYRYMTLIGEAVINTLNYILEESAENEKLKEKINSYNCSANCYKYKEAEKYKQALEYIKEIANHLKEDTGRYNIYDLSDKINEVLN